MVFTAVSCSSVDLSRQKVGYEMFAFLSSRELPPFSVRSKSTNELNTHKQNIPKIKPRSKSQFKFRLILFIKK